jgi:hypothetical protein
MLACFPGHEDVQEAVDSIFMYYIAMLIMVIKYFKNKNWKLDCQRKSTQTRNGCVILKFECGNFDN